MAFTRREAAILVVGDFLILCASLWAALTIRNLALPSARYFETLFGPFLPIFLLSLVVFYIAGLYEKQTTLTRRVMGERVAWSQFANVILAALLFFVLQLSVTPKTILAIYLVVSVILISVWRFYRMQRERSIEMRTCAVLIGRGEAVEEAYREAADNSRLLIRFTERVDPAKMRTSEELAASVRSAIQAGARVVVLDTRDEVVERALPILYELLLEDVAFIEFSEFYESIFDRVPLDHIDYAWLLGTMPERHALYDAAKRTVDLIGALAALSIASPVILGAAALVRATGPAFLRNERIGKGGRPFHLYKLRTMLYDDRGDPGLHAKNRITRIGTFLRRSRIDELPQLWNIVKGDASFIGPRPELPALAVQYEAAIPYYQARHSISPGLSGWAQLRERDAPKGGVDIERTRKKLSYDLYYLKHRSLGLDLAIMLKTLRALASFSGK